MGTLIARPGLKRKYYAKLQAGFVYLLERILIRPVPRYQNVI
jgi:hypothetical protein